MPAPKGTRPPAAGMGRIKGSKNKVTRELKEMILGALDAADKGGGIGYLTRQANDNPSSFMALVGKVLPMTVSGDPNNPLAMSIAVSFVKADE